MNRCDKGTKRSPCADGERHTMTCWCGRTYTRCATHGAKSGARRSLAGHHRVGNHDRRMGIR